MYVPPINKIQFDKEIINFIKKYSFGLILSNQENRVIGTHVPIISNEHLDELTLFTHIAKNNNQWQNIENEEVLVIFSEPHGYVSTRNYEKKKNVPTWNYISVHLYGKARIINAFEDKMKIIYNTIEIYEEDYLEKWKKFDSRYKENMLNGIICLEIKITEIKEKEKISQNRTKKEINNIIQSLKKDNLSTSKVLAEYMKSYYKE
jgi:transcriptional regulator